MKRDDSEPVFPHWGKIVRKVAGTLGRTVHPQEVHERGLRRIAKGSQVGEIAVRAWTEPDGWKPARRRRRNRVDAPQNYLAVTAVPAPGSDALWFLLWAFGDVRSDRPPAMGVAWREGIPARDITGIQAWAESEGLLRARVGPLQEFLKRVFRWLYRKGYRIPLVGWVLPRDLGRMASDWSRCEDNGYSLVLWTQPDRQKRTARRHRRRVSAGRIENPNRPRVNLVGIGGGRALMSFTGRLHADLSDRTPEGSVTPKKGWNYPGRFLDLPAFTAGLDGIESDSLDEAAAYGVEVEHPHPTGDVLGDALADGAARLRTICRLYRAAVAEHDRHTGIDLHPNQVFGPATYARAYLEAAGLDPLLRRFGDLPRWVLAKSFAAHHGGEHRIGFLVPPEVAVPVIPVDFSGQFPAVAVRGGVWELFCAKSLEVEEQTVEDLTRFVHDLAVRVRAWIAGDVSDGPPITDAEWRHLMRTFVDVIPEGAMLPHKRRRPGGKTWQMRVGPLTSLEAIPFCLADVLRATLESPDLVVPRIVSGFTLVPHGRVRIRSMTLPDGTVVAPGEDLIRALVRMRKAVAKREDLSPEVRERLASWSKGVVNAIVSGITAQMDPKGPVEGTRKVHVHGYDGSHRVLRRHVVEQPGAWCFPPIAAGVTAGGRLLLYLARALVQRMGGVTLYEAVDSLAIVAGEEPGYIAVPGGPVIREEAQCVNVLSPASVRTVMERLEVFSPYDPDPAGPVLLKVEKEAVGRKAFMLAVSPLRSYLYAFTYGDGQTGFGVEVLKASEQSLGQLLPPPGCGPDWIERAAEHVLKLRLGIASKEPPGWGAPALAVVPVAVPGESVDGRGRERRPWSLLAVARPHPVHPPTLADGRVALPAALWEEGFDHDRPRWFDLATGEPIPGPVRTAPTGEGEIYGPKSWVLSYRTVIASHFSRVPDHVLGPNGEPAIAGTFGMLTPAPMEACRVRLIGREMNQFDRVGVTTDPVYADYTDERASGRVALLVLRDSGPTVVARETGYPAASVRRFLSTGRTGRERLIGYVQAADRLATDALLRWDLQLVMPPDAGTRCHLYLREAGRQPRTCWGCGKVLAGRQTKWCGPKCKVRGWRGGYGSLTGRQAR